MTKIQKSVGLLLLMFTSLLALTVFAQTNVPPPVTPPQAPPASVTAFFQKFSAWQFVLIPIVTVFIQVCRKFTPKIPSSVWPYVGPFLGAGFDWLATNFGWWSGNVAVGAMLGGLATWFHQLDANGPNLLLKIHDPNK